mmetsp:Transcript_14113/g.48556  ORF Transcript_14113/g.48556 Transcript_14113/m.48556 type:complete len:97 (-) Transcript_14113:673-963(-)
MCICNGPSHLHFSPAVLATFDGVADVRLPDVRPACAVNLAMGNALVIVPNAESCTLALLHSQTPGSVSEGRRYEMPGCRQTMLARKRVLLETILVI